MVVAGAGRLRVRILGRLGNPYAEQCHRRNSVRLRPVLKSELRDFASRRDK